MSKSSTVQDNSAVDRAIFVTVASLLPVVFIGMVASQLWPGSADKTQPVIADDHTPEREVPSVVALARAPLVSSSLEAADQLEVSFAPLEVTTAGRAIVDPLAFAPAQLPPRDEASALIEVMAASKELDLYGHALKPQNRFGLMKKEVTEKRKVVDEALRRVPQLRAASRLFGRGLRINRSLTDVRAEHAEALKAFRGENYDPADPFKPRFQPLKDWLSERDDLHGLPLAMGDECRLKETESRYLHRVSTVFRQFRRSMRASDSQEATDFRLLLAVREFQWIELDISGLMQVLSAEGQLLRLELVAILSSFNCDESSEALARIATYDLSPEVRAKAISVLNGRPRKDFREVFLGGLQYAWAPVADNAAEALVSLRDNGAIEDLDRLTRQRDPRLPYKTDDNQWAVHQFVRVNHMRNCLLCHAPSVMPAGQPTGTIPSPYEELPPTRYYQTSDYAVRADVTYLRQDFSIKQRVANHGPWPAEQRFDYFVRERKLNAEEAAELTSQYAGSISPQQSAAIYAMKQLLQPAAVDEQKSATANGLTAGTPLTTLLE